MQRRRTRSTGVIRRNSAHALPRVYSISNGKGGTGKTSITANIGGLAAAAGYKVLLIDFDPQGNLNRDLGYQNSDEGKAQASAIITGAPLPITAGIRPNLDIVLGGSELSHVVTAMIPKMVTMSEPTLADHFHSSLAAVVESYDIILIDTPPGDALLVESAFANSTGVLITTRPDEASLDGVDLTADRFELVRAINPKLQLIGAVIFATGTQSTRIDQVTREALTEIFGDPKYVFDTKIRTAEAAAVDSRREGKLIHEIAPEVEKAVLARFSALKESRPIGGSFHATNLDGIVEDYQNLTLESLRRISWLEEQTS